MATAFETARLTTEQLLAMPDDGVERWLIDGQLRVKVNEFGNTSMTIRNRFHSRLVMTVGYFLESWNRNRSAPRGEIVGGEAGFRISQSPDTTVGVDVAYVTPEQSSQDIEGVTIFEGAPALAVEILSPSDTQQDIHEKVRKYLAAGTKMVWVIDPDYPTVTVHEAGKPPVLFNQEQEVRGEPYFPGLRLPVAELATPAKGIG